MEQFLVSGNWNKSYLSVTGVNWKYEFHVILDRKNMGMLLNKIQLLCTSRTNDWIAVFCFTFLTKFTSFSIYLALVFQQL